MPRDFTPYLWLLKIGALVNVCFLAGTFALPIESVERFSGEMSRVRHELEHVGGDHDVILVASTEAEIERLNGEIEELSQQVAAQGSQIEEAEKKVNKTHGDFMRTYEHLVDQIRRDVEKIQTYLS